MSDDPARSRFLMIQAVRLAGIVQVVLAMGILTRHWDLPAWVGYLLLVNGAADAFIIPLMLTRRWKSPRR